MITCRYDHSVVHRFHMHSTDNLNVWCTPLVLTDSWISATPCVQMSLKSLPSTVRWALSEPPHQKISKIARYWLMPCRAPGNSPASFPPTTPAVGRAVCSHGRTKGPNQHRLLSCYVVL